MALPKPAVLPPNPVPVLLLVFDVPKLKPDLGCWLLAFPNIELPVLAFVLPKPVPVVPNPLAGVEPNTPPPWVGCEVGVLPKRPPPVAAAGLFWPNKPPPDPKPLVLVLVCPNPVPLVLPPPPNKPPPVFVLVLDAAPKALEGWLLLVVLLVPKLPKPEPTPNAPPDVPP